MTKDSEKVLAAEKVAEFVRWRWHEFKTDKEAAAGLIPYLASNGYTLQAAAPGERDTSIDEDASRNTANVEHFLDRFDAAVSRGAPTVPPPTGEVAGESVQFWNGQSWSVLRNSKHGWHEVITSSSPMRSPVVLDSLFQLATDLGMALGIKAPTHEAVQRAAKMGLIRIFSCERSDTEPKP